MVAALGSKDRRVALLTTALLVALLAVPFGLHAAAFGSWIVDDAAISVAYAQNLADGHGFVAQPGASPVEGFSNPLWALVLASLFTLGVFGRADLLGLPGYVVATRALAAVAHVIVLISLLIVIRRVCVVADGRAARPTVALGAWVASGLLLAANPSYVIWMVSGLENPLLAATVAAMAAVTVSSVNRPTRRSMAALGVLSGVAALTRPDGVIYVGVVLVVALLAPWEPARSRWAAVGPGLAGFAVVFLPYVAFRRIYFHAWVPNTAVAKGQDRSSPGDLLRVGEVATAFGPWLLGLGVLGSVVAIARMRQQRNDAGLRTVIAGLAVVTCSLLAFVVLNPDWMAELRFLTPAWPLLTATVVLGVFQLVALARPRAVRVGVAGAAVLAAAVAIPGFVDRTRSFADTPNVQVCYVAERLGTQFDTAAERLGIDAERASLLVPDLGGTLLVSDLTVIDLAGLADREIARLRGDDERAELADYILTRLRPTFIHIHGPWVRNSGLDRDPRLRSDYVPLVAGEDYVRRDALTPDAMTRVEEVAVDLRRSADAAITRRAAAPTRACAELLFG